MTKDSYYFSHDYNARNDRKIAALVKKHKAAGYGVFWIACEMMHEEGGHIELDEITFGAIAKDSNEEVGVVKSIIIDCIKEFKLFKMEEDIVISGRVSRNLEKRQALSKSRAIAGQRGAIAQQNKAKERKEINNTITYTVTNIPYTAKTKDDMVVLEMIKIFKEKNPKYFFDEDKDYPACLQIAYKIAKAKGWKQSSVVQEKEKDVLGSWKIIVDFVKSDTWLSTRSLSDLCNGEWQRLVQKMSSDRPKETKEPELTAPRLKPLNGE
jgi:hypothetical protein